MRNKTILWLLIILTSFILGKICYAQSETINSEFKSIYCDQNVKLNFNTETFKKPTWVSCEVAPITETLYLKSNQNAKSKIYKLTIINKSSQNEVFARKDIDVIFPNEAIINNANKNNYGIYFYDQILNDWVSISTTNQDNELTGKIMHTEYFGVFEKTASSDNHRKLSEYIFVSLFLIVFTFVIIKIYKK